MNKVKDLLFDIKYGAGMSMIICLIFMGISFIFKYNVVGIILGIISLILGIVYWYFDKEYTKMCKDLYDTNKNITVGKPDKNGFADTYIDGEKTNVRMLLFSEEQVRRLQGIGDDIHKRIMRKKKIEKILKNK